MAELTVPALLFVGALIGAGIVGAAFGWYVRDRRDGS